VRRGRHVARLNAAQRELRIVVTTEAGDVLAVMNLVSAIALRTQLDASIELLCKELDVKAPDWRRGSDG